MKTPILLRQGLPADRLGINPGALSNFELYKRHGGAIIVSLTHPLKQTFRAEAGGDSTNGFQLLLAKKPPALVKTQLEAVKNFTMVLNELPGSSKLSGT